MGLYERKHIATTPRIDPHSAGQPRDPKVVAEEDSQAKAAKKQVKALNRQPDETAEQHETRMVRLVRSKMSGAEVMEYDRQMAEMQREAKKRSRLKAEPFLPGEIISTEPGVGNPNDLQATMKFDITHPYAPNQEGEITIADLRQMGDKLKERRLQQQPTVGMCGTIRSHFAGMKVAYRFVYNAEATPVTEQTEVIIPKSVGGVVVGIRDGGGYAVVTIDLDSGDSVSIQMMMDKVPAKGCRGTVTYDTADNATFTPNESTDQE